MQKRRPGICWSHADSAHIISGKMNCLKRLIYLSIFVILDSINWHMNKEYTWVIGENERATAWFRGG